jgi:dienelactone hydrolase
VVNPLRAEPLPATKPLAQEGDLAAAMVAGIDKYLTRELAASVEKRRQHWKPDFSSAEAYAKSLRPNRDRLRKILGVVDQRVPVTDLELVATTSRPALLRETETYKVFAVRWPVLPGVDAEGLWLEPKAAPVACVVALPDADWTPEKLAGLEPGLPVQTQFARHLAASGCRVLVPTLIDRQTTYAGNPSLGRRTPQTHREFVYRMAFEMGRHVLGYEVQKVLAAVDWFTKEKEHPPVGVVGYGEGGRVALFSGAIDERIKGVLVSGAFGPQEGLWQEPIDRNVWSLLTEFGDAELVDLIVPRALVIEASRGPERKGPPLMVNATPGRLVSPSLHDAARELARSTAAERLEIPERAAPAVVSDPDGVPGADKPFARFLKLLARGDWRYDTAPPESTRPAGIDPAARQKRQFDQLVAFTQRLWRTSDDTRRAFWGKATPAAAQAWERSCQYYRNYFWDEVIGRLPKPTEPPNPRSRQVYDEPNWTGYEVMLDLYPDVFAEGILLVPKDLKPGEKRPVVVCQHGLEGTPRSVIDPEKRPVYERFAAKLADLGYVVYAPQNPYTGGNTFRQLQRKANPLKLSLFAFIVRQHETTLDWLATLPFVDADRIGFYGLSYGGKTAMRVPALLPRYKLSICSGDFNEWVGKNVSVDFRISYMWTFEYEMYEFDLGNTFNYAEMAYLIAPRPFMVERGHDDGVGIDEMVASEYAKVRYLYAKLKIPERTEIEFFPGVHQIHGQGTFAFLKKHLGEPRK